ncbi:MAG: imidazole glycerol phosphate synthase subunit HisH [Anaerovoracaceae bacterium]|jgi:glutamine amidotransferase
MIAVIDYGVGNLFSLQASLGYIGAETKVTGEKEDIRKADKIILPGVGAFSDAMDKLQGTGLVEIIVEETGKGKPLLGICLGMQLLFRRSMEYGEHKGLGLIPGVVAPLAPELAGMEIGGETLKVPHIGWNSLQINEDPLFKYVKDGEYVYYVHSFYGKDCSEDTIATSDYGITVTGAVRRGSVYGTQFHPEKSGQTGLKILQAFNEL